MPLKKSKPLFFLFILFLILFIIYIYLDYSSFETVLVDGDLLKLKSKCSCKNQMIFVTKTSHNVNVRFEASEKYYNFSEKEFSTGRITCDLYNVLSRGLQQKVIGVSLYGNDPLYYESIKIISKLVQKYYPHWIIRIYYDYSINQTIICELECLKGNNIDFCNINEIPFGSPISNVWNAKHMHKMSWRWLPIGDPFVDVFLSRDSDSWFHDREYEAVREWLKTDYPFHLMRGFIYYFYF